MQTKLGVLFVVALLAAIGIAVFRYEASRTREAIQESVDKATTGAVREGIETATDAATETAERTMKAPAREGLTEILKHAQDVIRKKLPDRTGDSKPGSKGETEVPPPPRDPSDPDRPRTPERTSTPERTPPPRTPSEPKSEPKSEPETDDLFGIRPDDLIGGAFDFGKEVLKTGDGIGQQVFGLSIKEERAYGEELERVINADVKLVDDEKQQARIEKLAAPLLAARKRKGIDYRFHIVKDDSINAFSILGGSIYVNTGLLDFVQSDAELQFVVGHEIAHVDLGHCSAKMMVVIRATQLGADPATPVVQQAYAALTRGYSRDLELACDEWSYRQMLDLGRTPAEGQAFAKRMLKLEYEDPDQGKTKHILGIFHKEFSDFCLTHPAWRERYERLRELKD